MKKLAINNSKYKVKTVRCIENVFYIIYEDGYKLPWSTYVKEGGRIDN